jgi:hypothetical protein
MTAQQNLQPQVVSSLVERMLDIEIGVEAIITGIDKTGAHIYTIGGEVSQAICRDGRGFASVGTGERQFETEFMNHGYTSEFDALTSLLLLFTAKRRSQVSPGVGTATDAIIITPSMGNLFTEQVMQALEQYHLDIQNAAQRTRQEVRVRMGENPVFSQRSELPATEPPPAPTSPE